MEGETSSSFCISTFVPSSTMSSKDGNRIRWISEAVGKYWRSSDTIIIFFLKYFQSRDFGKAYREDGNQPGVEAWRLE